MFTKLFGKKSKSIELEIEKDKILAIEAQIAQIHAEREKAFREKAAEAARKEIHASRLFPAERAAFEANYVQALKDDALLPLREGSRVAQIEAIQSQRKPHRFTTECIDPEGIRVDLQLVKPN